MADDKRAEMLRAALPLIEVTPGMEDAYYGTHATAPTVFAEAAETITATLTRCASEGKDNG